MCVNASTVHLHHALRYSILEPSSFRRFDNLVFVHPNSMIYYFQKLVGVLTFPTKIQTSEGNSTTLKNWIQKLKGKPSTLKNWIQKMEGNSTMYSQKLCFDKFFEWKESNFLSGFLTNTSLNFCQECFLASELGCTTLLNSVCRT